MLRIDEDKIKDYIEDLKYYRGFLPFQFDAYISLSQRKKFLTSVGLWKEVHNRELEVMQGLRDNKPNDDKYLDNILRLWVVENPEFKDLVVFD